MLGASRKGWTEAIETGWTPKERLPATLAATQWALGQGVQLFRVHDAAAHRQLLTAWQASPIPAPAERAQGRRHDGGKRPDGGGRDRAGLDGHGHGAAAGRGRFRCARLRRPPGSGPSAGRGRRVGRCLPAEVARDAGLLLVMVVSAAQAEAVLFGPSGAVPALAPGAVVILSSTVPASAARRSPRGVADAGHLLLDAPVSGAPSPPRPVSFTVMASGPPKPSPRPTERSPPWRPRSTGSGTSPAPARA